MPDDSDAHEATDAVPPARLVRLSVGPHAVWTTPLVRPLPRPVLRRDDDVVPGPRTGGE